MGWFTTVPASFMLDLGTSLKLRMVSLTEDAIEKMQQLNAGFVRHVIPKATYAQYGIEEDVVTIQAPTILIAHAKTPADVDLQGHQGDRRGAGRLRARDRRP